MYDYNYVPQGWQCPICRRVYSPSTPFCYACNSSPQWYPITYPSNGTYPDAPSPTTAWPAGIDGAIVAKGYPYSVTLSTYGDVR